MDIKRYGLLVFSFLQAAAALAQRHDLPLRRDLLGYFWRSLLSPAPLITTHAALTQLAQLGLTASHRQAKSCCTVPRFFRNQLRAAGLLSLVPCNFSA